jgi:AcrR family transcriptional regulator
MRTYSKNEKLISLRRAHIAECAEREIVKNGYDATSMPDIAKACNMSIGALYRYIGSKEDILYLIIDHGIRREVAFYRKTFLKAGSLSPVEALRFALGEFIKSIDAFKDFVRFSYRTIPSLAPPARQNVIDIEKLVTAEFEKLLIRGCDEGVFEIDNVQMIVQTIISIAEMWALRRWAFKKVCTLNEYITFHTDYMLKLVYKEPRAGA